jgi:diguanylate cyclase (GGDEF)-like protein/PAS domain S-box-containing protein
MRSNPDEQDRLRRLEQYRISRTPPEAAFDDITRLLADLFGTPIAYLCTTEAECHWFKSRIGFDLAEIPRSISFCDHTLKQNDVMAVEDASLDERFAANPLVTGPFHIRFYAGITLRDADGFAMGTLAVADAVPRVVTEQQKESLKRLAGIALDRMELRKTQIELRETAAAAEIARQHAVSDNAELRQVINCLPQGIALLDDQNRLILWNENYEKMFSETARHFKPGASMEFIYRQYLETIRRDPKMKDVDEEQWLSSWLDRLNQNGSIVQQNVRDSRWIRYDQHLAADGKKIYVRTDITDERNANESFRLLFENNPVPMWVVERSTLQFIDVNAAALQLYGYTREEFLKMTSLNIRPEREYQRAWDDAQSNFLFDSGEKDWEHVKADGTEILVSSYAKPIRYDNREAGIISVIDVTERRKQDARIQYLAEHDVLTGLPNRRLFLDLLAGQLSKKTQNHSYTSIVLIDIDDFKGVNDSLGHQVGDELIVVMGDRLEELVGDRGIVARLGGDEFAVLLPMLTELGAAEAVAAELVNAFGDPLKVGDYDLQIGVSAGVSFSLDDSVESSSLLKNADLALYKAKTDGGGIFRVYEPQMSLQVMLRREVERDLRQALAKDQLVVHYQPLMELERGVEVGFEALLRWNHPQKGMVSPADFIPIAESSGMIVPMGNWVLEQSCKMATTLHKKLSVAVNISPAQFKSGKLVDVVSDALKKYGLAAHRLELEITESLLLEKSSETLDVLKSLKELGVVIALDDFGTGYSGLGYLNSFPIDKIKIDRSFIKNLGIEPRSKELVRAAINMGHSLGLMTLAEGIETPEQLDILRSLGCQQGQGFLFSPGIPASQINDKLLLHGNPNRRAIA